MSNDNAIEELLDIVKRDWVALYCVRGQTEAICLAAVKQNWHASRYVRDKKMLCKIKSIINASDDD